MGDGVAPTKEVGRIIRKHLNGIGARTEGELRQAGRPCDATA
jgi:hypothetical protein